jgi:hypothetical protein
MSSFVTIKQQIDEFKRIHRANMSEKDRHRLNVLLRHCGFSKQGLCILFICIVPTRGHLYNTAAAERRRRRRRRRRENHWVLYLGLATTCEPDSWRRPLQKDKGRKKELGARARKNRDGNKEGGGVWMRSPFLRPNQDKLSCSIQQPHATLVPI